jgi:4'-phosphopantetheinyl transferase
VLTPIGFCESPKFLRTGSATESVDVWRVDLDQPPEHVAEAASLLTDDERAQSQRCSPDVRRRTVVARGALRAVLARYLDRSPELLRFARHPSGKPTLAATSNQQLHFSVARSNGCCLIAVTTTGPVGVDVEQLVPLPDLDAIARRYFAPEESAEILRLSGARKLEAFYRCWVLKEAYLKATGIGLTGLPGVSVALHARPTLCRTDEGDPAAWTLTTLRPGADVIGAIAVRHLEPALSG